MSRVSTADARRAAAQLRRRAAEQAGERGGDMAYRAYRSATPGLGAARILNSPSGVRAEPVKRNGKDLTHTQGFFTRYAVGYPMWDDEGEYVEVVDRSAGANTIASKPEVAFLVNHAGTAMARTRNGTLVLEERAEGGWHEAWLNSGERQDVRDLVTAMKDGDMTEMSFAFMIARGMWSDDFMEYHIMEYDLDRGDVSAVTYGASPYTSIAARSAQMLSDLARLPRGAQREAMSRLTFAAGGLMRERDGVRHERVEIRHAARDVDPKASPAVRRLQSRLARTADRFVNLADGEGLMVADLVTVRLPWYEIRAAQSADDVAPDGPPAEATDVFIFDEIGGSFGVSAEEFAHDLNDITTPQINLRINSPGGSVIEAMAIHSALMHHASHVTAYVDGIAASAASIVALGGDEIVTMPGAQWMLHNASMMTDGQAKDMRQAATFLDRQSGNIAELYARRMGVATDVAQKLMDDETWAFDQESVDLGLADRIGGRNPAKPVPADLADRMTRSFDLTRYGYRYAGRSAAPSPQVQRAGVGESHPDARRILAEAVEEGMDRIWSGEPVQPVDAPADQPDTTPAEERSSAKIMKGRSIALIEAELDADMI